VDTVIQHHESEKGLRLFNQHVLGKECQAANKDNLFISKYYVKCLLCYDEH
jgi:hypothetical protein